MACCHVYAAGYNCDCAEPWKEAPEDMFEVGAPVRIRRDVVESQNLPFEYGIVTQICPEKGGCLVMPIGGEHAFGWTFDELESVDEDEVPGWPTATEAPTRFERELDL